MSKLAQGRLCVIHNNVAEASVKLEVSEQRVVAYLTSLINKNDQDFKTYTIAVKDLATALSLNRKDFYKEVKDTTKSLMRKVMSLRPLDGRPGELQIAWLSKARYIDGEGIVELRFDPDLKPYLLQLKEHFTKFPLRDVIRFKSQFSMPIYLLLKQYLAAGCRELKIDDLKLKLGLGEKYKQYGHFKDKVLTIAVNEINEKTSIDVDFSEVREGRKVVAVRFIIKSKPQKSADVDMFAAQEEIKAAEKENAATYGADLLRRFTTHKIPEAKAVAYLTEYGEGYCLAQLKHLEERLIKAANGTGKPITNVPKWLDGCMKNNYAKYINPASEAAAVAASENQKQKKPIPDCPKCKGEGYFEEHTDDERYNSRMTKCDCWR